MHFNWLVCTALLRLGGEPHGEGRGGALHKHANMQSPKMQGAKMQSAKMHTAKMQSAKMQSEKCTLEAALPIAAFHSRDLYL